MSERERNLVITGMMGTGKTSVARLAARALGRDFIDCDDELEKRFQKSVASIFRDEGEGAFRKAEFEVCQELAARGGLVIATGGGFLVPLRSQRLMNAHAVFCLNASVENMIERTRNYQKRPLISQDGKERAASLREIFGERQDAYQRIFHQVDTNGKSAQQVCNEIVARYKLDDPNDRIRMVKMPLVPPYPVVVKEGVAFEIPQRLLWAGLKAPRILVFTNEKLKALYGDKIAANCAKEKLSCEWLMVPDGEQHKTLATVQKLYKDLLLLSAKRDDVVVAFGGGVVGDIAGFVAATYMRGLRLVQVPTTLLAMVDSSIGGKTGVDLDEGKNLVGAFKQPVMVLADTGMLSTLPEIEFRSGMAEVIKHAMIADPGLFEMLESEAALSHAELVFRALLVKADIVEEDPFEHGRRAVLNLGHTFGHAIEMVSGYKVRHGFAVAIGMVMACKLAHKLNLCDAGLEARVERVLKRFELPTEPSGISVDQIIDAMQHDKKGSAQGMRFVVPHHIGDVKTTKVSDLSLLRSL